MLWVLAAMGRLGVDFPLADFLTDAPNKAFLSGVTAGRVVNTVMIDGVSQAAQDDAVAERLPGIVFDLLGASRD